MKLVVSWPATSTLLTWPTIWWARRGAPVALFFVATCSKVPGHGEWVRPVPCVRRRHPKDAVAGQRSAHRRASPSRPKVISTAPRARPLRAPPGLASRLQRSCPYRPKSSNPAPCRQAPPPQSRPPGNPPQSPPRALSRRTWLRSWRSRGWLRRGNGIAVRARLRRGLWAPIMPAASPARAPAAPSPHQTPPPFPGHPPTPPPAAPMRF
jgi:hypothetical protein